ncbi:MAG: hypothetical protein DHS20C10_03750 [marine bacterium B5-7]|nr:MAG: hypothetical protein DHS20C10_03750 [marine bacterium B5-7]
MPENVETLTRYIVTEKNLLPVTHGKPKHLTIFTGGEPHLAPLPTAINYWNVLHQDGLSFYAYETLDAALAAHATAANAPFTGASTSRGAGSKATFAIFEVDVPKKQTGFPQVGSYRNLDWNKNFYEIFPDVTVTRACIAYRGKQLLTEAQLPWTVLDATCIDRTKNPTTSLGFKRLIRNIEPSLSPDTSQERTFIVTDLGLPVIPAVLAAMAMNWVIEAGAVNWLMETAGVNRETDQSGLPVLAFLGVYLLAFSQLMTYYSQKAESRLERATTKAITELNESNRNPPTPFP